MRTALQLSGGRDSLAALFLLEPFWDGMTVVWCNPGDSAPELYELMAKVERIVPHFDCVVGCAPATRRERGDPTKETWADCCAESIWKPMRSWVRVNDVRYLVRGTRKVDPIAWPRPGEKYERVYFVLPLWEWDDAKLAEMTKGIEARGFKAVYPHDCQSCPVRKPCDRPELRNVA